VGLAIGHAAFCVETLTFQVLLAFRAVEAFRVVRRIDGFHPPIACLDWKLAGDAFGRVQLIPIFLAVWSTFFQKEC